MKYTVEILKGHPFNGKKYENHRRELVILDREDTAKVRVDYENGESIILEYGYLDTEDVYELIKQNKDVNLNRTYIKDFDFSKVIEISNKIRKFSAYYAFFDGNIDFSHAEFCDGDVNLSHINYGDGDVCFYKTNFGDGDVYFHKSNFGNGNIDFNSSIFGNGHADFKFTKFGKGNKDFNGCNFGDGDVYFKGTSFGDGDIFFRKAKFGNGHIDFNSTIFGKGNIYFNNTEFGDGNIDFYYSNFGVGHVDFDNSTVGYGRVDFRHTIFEKGEVNFSNMTFEKGNVDFSYIQFGEGNANFSYMKFMEGNVNFNSTNFGNGNIDFSRTCFYKGIIIFNNVRFGIGDINFSKVDFGDNIVDFSDISFDKGKLSFENSKAKYLIFNNCIFDDYCDMRLEYCEQLSLDNCTFKDVFDLLKDENYDVELGSISLINAKNLGQIYLDWHENHVKQLIFTQKHMNGYDNSHETNNKQKLEQFRLLKENFHALGKYEDEDKAYVEFKRLERTEEYNIGFYHKGNRKFVKNNNLSVKMGKNIRYIFNLIVLDKIGGYGTCPVNIFITMLATIFAYAGLYTIFPSMMLLPENCGIKGSFFRGFYLSIETFLTIGYGNISPANNISIIVAAIEGFTGVFLMYYFTVAFVRKILR
jgi:hypothetical protein